MKNLQIIGLAVGIAMMTCAGGAGAAGVEVPKKGRRLLRWTN